jgi:hypothetical protein
MSWGFGAAAVFMVDWFIASFGCGVYSGER